MACQNCSCGQAEIELARRVDKIEIKQTVPDKLMTGANTTVVLNGIRIMNPKSIEVKIDARGFGIVKLEMYASVDMDESVVMNAEIQENGNDKP